MDIPQIVFEEGIMFDDEAIYNDFLTYCEWFMNPTDLYFYEEDLKVEQMDYNKCKVFCELCALYIEPNLKTREVCDKCKGKICYCL
jgi:hypothetical protein